MDEEEDDGSQEDDDDEEIAVHERSQESQTAEDESQSTTTTTTMSTASAKSGKEKLKSPSDNENATTQAIPSLAEREAEEPVLEEGTSTLLLNISLSLTAQRFLGVLCAILAMIWTAYQVSENPDGLYASLCRSILTAFRVVCRVVTCKSCSVAHRHVPISTMDYPTDTSASFA